MKIRLGDTVVIISGKDKGKTGSVVRVLESDNRVIVEGINMRTRHIKRTQNQAGQKIVYEASIHASNVMMLDPKTKKPTRVGYKIDEKGKKSRIAKLSGEVITKAAAVKTPKKAAKGANVEKVEKESKETKKSEAPAAPTKQPFWKRSAKGEGEKGGGGSSGGVDANVIQTAHRSQGG
jgi:large subunit ribosomal protein L24